MAAICCNGFKNVPVINDVAQGVRLISTCSRTESFTCLYVLRAFRSCVSCGLALKSCQEANMNRQQSLKSLNDSASLTGSCQTGRPSMALFKTRARCPNPLLQTTKTGDSSVIFIPSFHLVSWPLTQPNITSIFRAVLPISSRHHCDTTEVAIIKGILAAAAMPRNAVLAAFRKNVPVLHGSWHLLQVDLPGGC